jgi:hypothetical protein
MERNTFFTHDIDFLNFGSYFKLLLLIGCGVSRPVSEDATIYHEPGLIHTAPVDACHKKILLKPTLAEHL